MTPKFGYATIRRAAQMFNLPVSEIVGPSRPRYYCEARFAIMLALRRRGMSTLAIGRLLNRDHSVVVHGLKRAAQIIANDPGYGLIVDELGDATDDATARAKRPLACGGGGFVPVYGCRPFDGAAA